MKKPYFWLIGTLALIIILTLLFWQDRGPQAPPTSSEEQKQSLPEDEALEPGPVIVAAPLKPDTDRVTKKPFGIFITPQNSPVNPEKFSGYHTGTDFEILAGEETAEVPFYSICEGEIKQIRTASGYGGLLVQSCNINSEPMIVVYGHIDTGSVSKKIGESFNQGEQIGILGQPPAETDGERKHLHLGIHKSNSINILGYVQSQSELSNWIDFQTLSSN